MKLEASIRLRAKPVDYPLAEQFMKELQANSSFFQRWKPNPVLPDVIATPVTTDKEFKLLETGVAAALKKLGWSKTKKSCPYYETWYDLRGGWPLRLSREAGSLDLTLMGDSVTADVPGTSAIRDAIKKNGFKLVSQHTSLDTEYLTVDSKGANAKTVALMVQSAIGADMKTNRPAYLEDPWSSTGKVKLFPGQTSSYDVTTDVSVWTVTKDSGRNGMTLINIVGKHSVTAWRKNK